MTISLIDSDCIDVALPLVDASTWGKRLSLLLALRRITREDPITYIGSYQLGQQVGASPHSVLRWLEEFVDRGILERHPAIDRRGMAGYSITEPGRWQVPWVQPVADADLRRARLTAILAARPGKVHGGALSRDLAKAVRAVMSPLIDQIGADRRPHRAIARPQLHESAPSRDAGHYAFGVTYVTPSLREGEGEGIDQDTNIEVAAAIQRSTGKRLWGTPEREVAALVAEVGPGPVIEAAARLGPDIAAPAIPAQLRIAIHDMSAPPPPAEPADPEWRWDLNALGEAVRVPVAAACENGVDGTKAAQAHG